MLNELRGTAQRHNNLQDAAGLQPGSDFAAVRDRVGPFHRSSTAPDVRQWFGSSGKTRTVRLLCDRQHVCACGYVLVGEGAQHLEIRRGIFRLPAKYSLRFFYRQQLRLLRDMPRAGTAPATVLPTFWWEPPTTCLRGQMRPTTSAARQSTRSRRTNGG